MPKKSKMAELEAENEKALTRIEQYKTEVKRLWNLIDVGFSYHRTSPKGD